MFVLLLSFSLNINSLNSAFLQKRGKLYCTANMVELSTLNLILMGYKLNGTENWEWKSHQANLIVVIWSLIPSFLREIYSFYQKEQTCFCAINYHGRANIFPQTKRIKEMLYNMMKLIGLFQQKMRTHFSKKLPWQSVRSNSDTSWSIDWRSSKFAIAPGGSRTVTSGCASLYSYQNEAK